VGLVLASRSPRRIELLGRFGIDPRVEPADIDETPLVGESPVAYVERLAREKTRVAQQRWCDDIVLGADTTIDLDGEIFGKPDDEADARRMLRRLSARTHRVHTGIAASWGSRREQSLVVTSLVTFVPVTDETLEWYIGTGEWQGKAGAYAVQGLGGTLVEGVRGSLSNVIGLPLRETAQLLRLGTIPDEPVLG
jgi:septum formation protein